jgi:hypothetical protein
VLERNEQLVKDMENVKVQNATLREQVSKLETDLNDAQVCIHFLPEMSTAADDQPLPRRYSHSGSAAMDISVFFISPIICLRVESNHQPFNSKLNGELLKVAF